MSCIEVMRKLTDYLQGDLDSHDAIAVRRHVAHCRQCRLVCHSATEILRTYFSPDEETRAVKSQIESHAA